jgi:hypothetical protein
MGNNSDAAAGHLKTTLSVVCRHLLPNGAVLIN